MKFEMVNIKDPDDVTPLNAKTYIKALEEALRFFEYKVVKNRR